MTRNETPIVDLDTYRQYPFDPGDFPNVAPEAEAVEWHPDDEPHPEAYLLEEIAFLRETVTSLSASSNRRFDRTDLALAATLGVLATVLAILTFGPG